MDSKFGPDGALYVQVYDGFFRAGPNVGIYRYDYIGGPPTPGCAPRRSRSANREVRFASGGSGGVAYEWDFGDGATSTEANPTHTYAEARRYTAELTVTYADGGKDSKTVTVDVLARGRRDGAGHDRDATRRPSPDGTYSAGHGHADRDGPGTGVERTEYRINGGDWQELQRADRREQPGEYQSSTARPTGPATRRRAKR